MRVIQKTLRRGCASKFKVQKMKFFMLLMRSLPYTASTSTDLYLPDEKEAPTKVQTIFCTVTHKLPVRCHFSQVWSDQPLHTPWEDWYPPLIPPHPSSELFRHAWRMALELRLRSPTTTARNLFLVVHEEL